MRSRRPPEGGQTTGLVVDDLQRPAELADDGRVVERGHVRVRPGVAGDRVAVADRVVEDVGVAAGVLVSGLVEAGRIGDGLEDAGADVEVERVELVRLEEAEQSCRSRLRSVVKREGDVTARGVDDAVAQSSSDPSIGKRPVDSLVGRVADGRRVRAQPVRVW